MQCIILAFVCGADNGDGYVVATVVVIWALH